MWKALRHHGQATCLSQRYFNQYFKHMCTLSFLFFSLFSKTVKLRECLPVIDIKITERGQNSDNGIDEGVTVLLF